MTAVTGTPYNTTGALAIATLTASLGILAPNNPASLLFTTDLRMVPTRLLLLPSSTGSSTITTTWFVVA